MAQSYALPIKIYYFDPVGPSTAWLSFTSRESLRHIEGYVDFYLNSLETPHAINMGQMFLKVLPSFAHAVCSFFLMPTTSLSLM